MKLKTNLKKWEAQITFTAADVRTLKNVLEKIQFQLPYLEMETVSELLEKFRIFNKAIDDETRN